MGRSDKAKKLEYARIFNELFGTHIHWEKLSLEELTELATVLNHPEVILSRLGITDEYKRKLLREKIIDLVGDIADAWGGPLASLAKKILTGEHPEEKKQ